jgi:hypothetical protein
MKKLLLVCAMSAVTTVGLYGAASGYYRSADGEIMRPGGLSAAAAEQKAKELVAQYGPNLDRMQVEGFIDALTRSLNLGDAAVDPTDLVIDTLKTANRIFVASPRNYRGLPADLQEYVRYLSLYDRARLAQIQRVIAAKGY